MSLHLANTIEEKITKLSKLPLFSDRKTLVVYSHLRWEFVKQRPQHLMERLSKHFDILFIEEPIFYTDQNKGSARELKINTHLTVVQPRIDWNNPAQLAEITQAFLSEKEVTEAPLVWFYSPAFVDVIDEMEFSTIIFDCMDELKNFKGASPELLEQENRLLKIADVVFTGGKSLYESKKRFNHNVHCFPSSVDRKHFEKALNTVAELPTDLQKVKQPIVGYYGVIDERIDVELIGKVAKALPHISFVMIGPVVKIDEASLPKLPNIHYLGGKDYQQLPEYLAHFTVAMMPFALNEATQFISPTKTLEFMAALKPIVSTPITDVVRDYKKEVYIAMSKDDDIRAQEFVTNISKAIFETENQTKKRERLQTAVLEKTSWDKTAATMHELIEKAYEKNAQKSYSLGENELTTKVTRNMAISY